MSVKLKQISITWKKESADLTWVLKHIAFLNHNEWTVRNMTVCSLMDKIMTFSTFILFVMSCWSPVHLWSEPSRQTSNQQKLQRTDNEICFCSFLLTYTCRTCSQHKASAAQIRQSCSVHRSLFETTWTFHFTPFSWGLDFFLNFLNLTLYWHWLEIFG